MDRSSGLVAVVCTAVAFFVGVLVARVVPGDQGIAWGNVAEWVAGVSAAITALIAWLALRSWKEQIRGQSSHAVAAEIAEAAQLLKYHFYDARSPTYLTSEFPNDYNDIAKPSPAEQAVGFSYLFSNRYRELEPRILKIATLRAKAGPLLSEEIASQMGALARKAGELQTLFRQRVHQIRLGPEGALKKWAKRVKESAEVDAAHRTDALSIEFDELYATLLVSLRLFL